MIINNLNIRIINPTTGEFLRQLTLDPDRDYQPQPKTDPRVGSRCSYVSRHHMVDTSPVRLTSLFAAISDPLAHRTGRGLPILGGGCSQHGVPETGLHLRFWRRQGSAAGGDEDQNGERRRRDQVGLP